MERSIGCAVTVAPNILWEFERLAPEGASRKVGHPDHAMLICEFDQDPESPVCEDLSRTIN